MICIDNDNHTPECSDEYLQILASIETCLENTMYDALYICGDFNADPYSSRLWEHCRRFCTDLNLVCFDYELLSADSFTFISNNNLFCKWLDHVLGTKNCTFDVNKILIRNDIVGSDHLPIEFYVKIKSVISSSPTDDLHNNEESTYKPMYNSYVNFDSLSKDNIKLMSDKVAYNIKSCFDNLCVICTGEAICHNNDHMSIIDTSYDILVHEINTVMTDVRNGLQRNLSNNSKSNNNGDVSIDDINNNNNDNSNQNTHANNNNNNNNKKYNVIPGWNRNVKYLYKNYRVDFVNWVRGGRNRYSLEFFEMQTSRKLFKTALKECKSNKKTEVAISIAEKYDNKNSKGFWNDIRKNKKIEKKSAVIDGVTDEKQIINDMTDAFSSECCHDESDSVLEKDLIKDLLNRIKNERCFYINTSVESLKKHILLLSTGTGHDNIHAKFLKCASDDFLLCISIFLNSCFAHGHFPGRMLEGIIKPIIKNASGNCTDSKNYRPIMQSSCILKLVELYLQDVLLEKLTFNKRQFGYTKGMSTSEATFVLKETIYQQFSKGESTYALFIDLSKAFDNINHFKLGKILLKRNIPPDLVWIILKFLRNQKSILKWGNNYGEPRNIDRGSRQGGILSPLFFKLYINHILDLLADERCGVQFDLCNINVLAYADDIVILSRSIVGLKRLYSILKIELVKLDLKINTSKSKIMLFDKKKKLQFENINLNGDIFEVCTKFKYLGYVITSDLSDTEDVSTRLKSFYLKFFSIKRNFTGIRYDILQHLFKSFCMPNYGLNMWNIGNILNKKDYKAFHVAYSNCIKSIYDVSKFSSSHFIFNSCNMLMFNHYNIYVQCRYFKSIFDNPSGLIYLLPGLKNGTLIGTLKKFVREAYDITIFDNAIEAINSRIFFIQKLER